MPIQEMYCKVHSVVGPGPEGNRPSCIKSSMQLIFVSQYCTKSFQVSFPDPLPVQRQTCEAVILLPACLPLHPHATSPHFRHCTAQRLIMHIPSPTCHPIYMPGNPPAPPRPCASPCIFSLTLTLTSKNLATHRSRHTLSPLLRSASRYDVSMHFLLQLCTRLAHQRKSAAYPIAQCEGEGELGGRGTYRAYMSETMSISASAWASFCSEESWGWRLKRKDIVVAGVWNIALGSWSAACCIEGGGFCCKLRVVESLDGKLRAMMLAMRKWGALGSG